MINQNVKRKKEKSTVNNHHGRLKIVNCKLKTDNCKFLKALNRVSTVFIQSS